MDRLNLSKSVSTCVTSSFGGRIANFKPLLRTLSIAGVKTSLELLKITFIFCFFIFSFNLLYWLRGSQFGLFIGELRSGPLNPGFVSQVLASSVSLSFVFLELLFGVDLLLTDCALVFVDFGLAGPSENPPAFQ